jgi:hypothetical protein
MLSDEGFNDSVEFVSKVLDLAAPARSSSGSSSPP